MNISNFVTTLCEELISVNRHRTPGAYQSTLKRLITYYGNKNINFTIITNKEFIKGFEEYLLCDGLSRNSVSFYLRMLRSIYHQAVARGLAKFIPGLFKHVFTGVEPTAKRAIKPEAIQDILTAQLEEKPHLADARDIFMLSFCLQGIPFVDLAFLKKTDLKNGLLTYRRKKTGGLITVAVLPQAEEIIRKYALLAKDSPYLLPIIQNPGKDEYRQYQSALGNYNRRLKALAGFLNLSEKLTSYVARHSWATTAYHNGISAAIISQGLGHRTEEITRIYLASFNQNVILDANTTILAAIIKENTKISNQQQENSQQQKTSSQYIQKNNAHHFKSENADNEKEVYKQNAYHFKSDRWQKLQL